MWNRNYVSATVLCILSASLVPFGCFDVSILSWPSSPLFNCFLSASQVWVRGYMVVFAVKPLEADLWYWVKTKLTWLKWVCACCCNANGLYLRELIFIWYVSMFVWVTQWRQVYFFKRAAKSAGGLVKQVLYTTNFYLYLVQACMLLLLLLLLFGGIHSTSSVQKNITSDQDGK